MKGNVYDCAEVVIETCSGDRNILEFDDGSPRSCRRQARDVGQTMVLIALSGKPMSHFKDPGSKNDWFADFPASTHIVRVQVRRRNHIAGTERDLTESIFSCEHTAVKA